MANYNVIGGDQKQYGPVSAGDLHRWIAEGRLDAQTAHGKVVAGVTARCAAREVPAVALVGAVADGAESMYARGLTACFSLCNRPMSEADAVRDAAALLEHAAENVVRVWAARAT